MIAALPSRADATSSDSLTKVSRRRAISRASPIVAACCRISRARIEIGVAAESGTGPLAALIVTVSPLSFMPDSTPIIPAQPMLTKGCPACGRQKVTILWRAKSSPM